MRCVTGGILRKCIHIAIQCHTWQSRLIEPSNENIPHKIKTQMKLIAPPSGQIIHTKDELIH